MVIVEENRNRSEVIGDPEMPYFNSLATKYENTTSWDGVSHPSLPNYLALISGSTQGETEDATEVSFSGQTLGSQLTAAGVPWRAYMEGLPEPGYEGAALGEYAKKHNPFAYFPSTNGANVVPGSQYATDLAAGTLPDFVWYTPNLVNDGHEGSNTAVDANLRSLLTPLLASTWYREGGKVIITWDEDEGEKRIPVVVVSGSGCGCTFTAPGNHYGTLAAIEDAYGLPLLGNAAGTTPLELGATTGSTGAGGTSGAT
jgi:acid phosphatase